MVTGSRNLVHQMTPRYPTLELTMGLKMLKVTQLKSVSVPVYAYRVTALY